MTTSFKQSFWVRAFLTICVFQMALVLPIKTQANILDIVAKLGPPPVNLNQYIAPLKLEYLPPIAGAITSCDLSSDTAVAKCADKILATEASSDAIGGATATQIRAMLEIYLDISEGDVAELFNDVVKLAAGQSPLDLACSVIAVVAGGFPVCDALKALYEIGKAAYEVGKAIVGALADLACGVYELFGGSCDSSRKVGPAEFMATYFVNTPNMLAGSIKARVASEAEWQANKKAAFAEAKTGFFASAGGGYLVTDANLEAAWQFYASNIVYPEWDKLVRANLLSGYKQAIQSSIAGINDAFRNELMATPSSQGYVREKKIKERYDACVATDATLGPKVRDWINAGRATPAESSDVGLLSCAPAVGARVLPKPDCAVALPEVAVKIGPFTIMRRVVDATCQSINATAICKSAQEVLGTDDVRTCNLANAGAGNSGALSKVLAELQKQGQKCSFGPGVSVQQTAIQCEDPAYTFACRFTAVGLYGKDFLKPGVAECKTVETQARKDALAAAAKLAGLLPETVKLPGGGSGQIKVASGNVALGVCTPDAKDAAVIYCKGVEFPIGKERFQSIKTAMSPVNVRACKGEETPTSDAKHWLNEPCVATGGKPLAENVILSVNSDPVKPAGAGVPPVAIGGLQTPPKTSPAATPPATPVQSGLQGGLGGLSGPAKAAPPSVPLTGLSGGTAAGKPGATGLAPPVGGSSANTTANQHCKSFLGRKDELLCDAQGFAACKLLVDGGKMKVCRREGSQDIYKGAGK